MQSPVLESIFERCKYDAPVDPDKRDICFDGILCLLLSEGLTSLFAQLKKWQGKNKGLIQSGRKEIENGLMQYALLKNLEVEKSKRIANLISRYITVENLDSIILEIEQMNPLSCKEKYNVEQDCKNEPGENVY